MARHRLVERVEAAGGDAAAAVAAALSKSPDLW